ncbi:hypothetical protein C8Q73DRAFT_494750 [Cubamyces lactineus]|nr:hypothetical protein C8Q73DRAFT_494750 [Cubamyces lactineus]
MRSYLVLSYGDYPRFDDGGSLDSDGLGTPTDTFGLVRGLGGLALISAKMLREAWPKVYFRDGEDMQIGTVLLYAEDDELPCYKRAACTVARAIRFDQPEEPVKVFFTDDTPTIWHKGVTAKYDSKDLTDNNISSVLSVLSDVIRDEGIYNFAIKVVPYGLSNDEYCPLSREQQKADMRKSTTPLTDDKLRCLGQIIAVEASSTGFVDLSGFDLLMPQIVKLLMPLPQVRSLSLARNSRLLLHDIPMLLDTFPHILRLNIMNCPSINDDDLLALMRDFPLVFATLEGLQHSSLLTHDKPPSYPITFTFICSAYPESLVAVCLSMFTLDQIFRAIMEILSVAWGMHGRDLGGETTALDARGLTAYLMVVWQRSVMARTEFSYTGCNWQDPRRRPIIAVPGPMYAMVSDTTAGSWAFHFEWDDQWKNRSWGFVRHDSPLLQASHTDAPGQEHDCGMRAAGKVYDLRGFLRCMADEGRPYPSHDLVARLEAMLDARDESEGTPICPSYVPC